MDGVVAVAVAADVAKREDEDEPLPAQKKARTDDDDDDEARRDLTTTFDLIPALNDTKAPKPHVGQHDISPEAVKQRAKRIFTPRADGSLKVSQQIFDEWKGKGPRRRNLEMIFKQCGYDPEPSLSFKNCLGGGSWIEGSPDPYYQLHQ